METYHVVCHTNALCARGTEVGGDDALDTDFLRRAEDLALVADDPGVDGADEDIDVLNEILQLLVVIGHASHADLGPSSLELLRSGLRNRRRTDEYRNTLERIYWPKVWSVRIEVLYTEALTEASDLRSASTMLRPVKPVPPRTRTKGLGAVVMACVSALWEWVL